MHVRVHVSIVASADQKVWAGQTAERGEGAVAEGAEENGRLSVTLSGPLTPAATFWAQIQVIYLEMHLAFDAICFMFWLPHHRNRIHHEIGLWHWLKPFQALGWAGRPTGNMFVSKTFWFKRFMVASVTSVCQLLLRQNKPDLTATGQHEWIYFVIHVVAGQVLDFVPFHLHSWLLHGSLVSV